MHISIKFKRFVSIMVISKIIIISNISRQDQIYPSSPRKSSMQLSKKYCTSDMIKPIYIGVWQNVATGLTKKEYLENYSEIMISAKQDKWLLQKRVLSSFSELLKFISVMISEQVCSSIDIWSEYFSSKNTKQIRIAICWDKWPIKK